MTRMTSLQPIGPKTQIALDIGSTVVKVARLDAAGRLESQQFFPRDFEAGIARQVHSVLAKLGIDVLNDSIVGCSSANGGLRVGVLCLSKQYSGATLRNSSAVCVGSVMSCGVRMTSKPSLLGSSAAICSDCA